MANLQRGGFRWVGNLLAPNSTTPPTEILPAASAYATVLYIGDPVKLISDGTIQVCSAGDTVYGIFDGAAQYYDGTVVRSGGKLPVSTYGSVLSRQSLCRVIPARGQLFAICADDATTATTQAAHQAFVGENCEWIAATGTNDNSGALLDISTHNTTNTLSVRLERLPNQGLQDFASAYVEYHVQFNLIQGIGSGSTTAT